MPNLRECTSHNTYVLHLDLREGLDGGECQFLLCFGATAVVSVAEFSMGSTFRKICHVCIGKIPASTRHVHWSI